MQPSVTPAYEKHRKQLIDLIEKENESILRERKQIIPRG
jgi:hypothetical protein